MVLVKIEGPLKNLSVLLIWYSMRILVFSDGFDTRENKGNVFLSMNE